MKFKRKKKKKVPESRTTEEAQETGSVAAKKSQMARQLAPDLGYNHAKNILWNEYMTAITPHWQNFRKCTREFVEQLAHNPKSKHGPMIKKLAKARDGYTNTVLDTFSEYIGGLTKAWINDLLRTNDVDLKTTAAIYATAQRDKKTAKPKKKRGKKQAKKRKFLKPTPTEVKK